MSAYLMSAVDTALLAAYAEHHGLTPNAARAATTLRSANNAALAARYGDTAMPLPRGTAKKLGKPEMLILSVAPTHIHRLACTYAYQCCEGDVWETHKGAALLRKIQQHAADAIHASDEPTKGE